MSSESFSRYVFGRRLLQFLVDAKRLAGYLSAPVGTHYRSSSVVDVKSMFKGRLLEL